MLSDKKSGDSIYVVSRFSGVPPVCMKVQVAGYKFVTTTTGAKFRKSDGAPVQDRKVFRDSPMDSRAWPSKEEYEDHMQRYMQHFKNLTLFKRKVAELTATTVTPEKLQAIQSILDN